MDTETIKALFGIEIDEAILICAVITHPSIETVRVVNNAPAEDGSNDIVRSDGTRFLAFPFTPELPGDNEDQPRARLRIANVPYTDADGNERRVSDSIVGLTEPPEIAFEVIRSSNPDTPFLRFPRFELRTAEIGAVEISGDLSQASFATEPFGHVRVTPELFPARFR